MANVARLIQSYPARLRKQMEANGQEAAEFLEARLKQKLGRSYPPSSRRGQFPARRSGRLQRESYAQARRVGDSVVITLAQPTPYAEPLAASGRLGPRAVVEEYRGAVEGILLRKGFGNLERLAGG